MEVQMQRRERTRLITCSIAVGGRCEETVPLPRAALPSGSANEFQKSAHSRVAVALVRVVKITARQIRAPRLQQVHQPTIVDGRVGLIVEHMGNPLPRQGCLKLPPCAELRVSPPSSAISTASPALSNAHVASVPPR